MPASPKKTANPKFTDCGLALIRENGDVISHLNFKRSLPKNIFSLFEGSEREFLAEKIKYNDIKMVLLVRGEGGPYLIYRELISQMYAAVLIKPRLTDREILYCVQNGIFESVLMSPHFENMKISSKRPQISDETRELGSLLSRIFVRRIFYFAHERDISEMLSQIDDVANAVFELFGCHPEFIVPDGLAERILNTEKIHLRTVHFTLIALAFCFSELASSERFYIRYRVSNDSFVIETFFDIPKDISNNAVAAYLKNSLAIKHLQYAFSVEGEVFYLIFAPYYSIHDATIKVEVPEIDYLKEVKKWKELRELL